MTRTELEKLTDAQLRKFIADCAGHVLGERAESVLAERQKVAS